MSTVDTSYVPIEELLLIKLKQINLLAFNVDGVFPDGRIYMGQGGEELKAFNHRNGYGLKALQKIGVQLATITWRRSNMVVRRMTALIAKHIHRGCENKQPALQTIQNQLSVTESETATIGDDMPDIGTFKVSQCNVCLQDGHPILAKQAHYQTCIKEEYGAVCKLCDLFLLAHGKLDTIHGASI